jgi:hypothetical protein
MPAFTIIAIMVAKNKGLGLLLAPAMFILGFTLIFSLAVSEMVKPSYQLVVDMRGMVPSLVLSVLFLILVIFYFHNLKVNENTN